MTEPLDQMRAWLVASLPRMRRFAKAIASRDDEADDLVQASIERALQDEMRPPDPPLYRWMLSIMCGAWKEMSVGAIPDRTIDPAYADSIRAAMVQLPIEQRMAVALVLIEGLSYKEAAEALAVPVDIMAAHLTRGRETLQALL